MTREEKLYEAITQVSDHLVEEAAQPFMGELRQPRSWFKYAAAAAACLALVFCFNTLFQPKGGSAVPNGGSGMGHDEGTVFMSYDGPVFPMDVLEQTELTAQRQITLDLSGRGMTVADAYTLSNSTEEDVFATLLYPFTAQLRTVEGLRPKLTVDGQPLENTLYQGAYAGGFQTAGGAGGEDLNLQNPQSWEDYRELLADGTYQQAAMDAVAELNIPVITYRFEGAVAPSDNQAASIGVQTHVDESRTTVLTYGFNGYAGWDNGDMCYSYGARKEGLRLLIVLGEDLPGLTVQGYRDGGCEDGEELSSVQLPRMIREETTLGAVLLDAVQDQHEENGRYQMENATVEQMFRATAQLLLDYGPLAETVKARYGSGMLDELLMDVLGQERVFYLAAQLTVPAGQQVRVEVNLRKNGSFDYACAQTKNRGVTGYDLTTVLGSDLTFTGQTAQLTGWEQVEIVRQNFGFDPENGITQVPLTLEHYYLEVR